MVRSFRRERPTRDVGRKLVIACEGEKTEYGYFEAIRQTMRLPTVKVRVVKPPGSDPLSVVRAALDERDAMKRELRWTRGDAAWAVFDGDEHIANNPSNWNDALQAANGNGINLAISNPCFEFWYLLHFQEHTASFTRQKARELLKKHVPDYEKANRLYPIPLKALTADAVERAKHLAVRSEANGLLPYLNPNTGVWKLVESLLALESRIA